MAKKTQISNLTAAKANKKDEFYTQLSDIEKELKHYKQHFQGKVVFCNVMTRELVISFTFFHTTLKILG